MGHSQGTTMLLAGTSMNPEYFNSKINGAILLAPATSLFNNHNDKSWVFWSNRFVANTLVKFSKYMHWMNWFPYSENLSQFVVNACAIFGNSNIGKWTANF